MRIASTQIIAYPSARSVGVKIDDKTSAFLEKREFEDLITYLKGLRDGSTDDKELSIFGATLGLTHDDLIALITYLKGVRDGRGWNAAV